MNIQDEKVPVKVKFVKPKYKDNVTEILAMFLGKTNPFSKSDLRLCYAHIGQHSLADKSFLRRKLATKEEYLPLLKELESIGYAVTVVNKESVAQ